MCDRYAHTMKHQMKAQHLKDKAHFEAAYGNYGHAAKLEAKSVVQSAKAFGASVNPFGHHHHYGHHHHGPFGHHSYHEFGVPGVSVITSQTSSTPYYGPQPPATYYYPPAQVAQQSVQVGPQSVTTVTTYPAPAVAPFVAPMAPGYVAPPPTYYPPPPYHY